ncbi:hypothetical protein LSAT2_002465 [Lamellibrachia satsuma]|nr:hypothetical protein LSAT2_002465 [Lamellibrachia satsuma]
MRTLRKVCKIGSQDANYQPINQHEKLSYRNPFRNSHAGDIVLRHQRCSNQPLPIVPESVLETVQQMQPGMPRWRSSCWIRAVRTQFEEVSCQMRKNTELLEKRY